MKVLLRHPQIHRKLEVLQLHRTSESRIQDIWNHNLRLTWFGCWKTWFGAEDMVGWRRHGLMRKTWFAEGYFWCGRPGLTRKNGLCGRMVCEERPNCCFWIEESDVAKAVIRILVPKLHIDDGLFLEVGGARLFISLGGPQQETLKSMPSTVATQASPFLSLQQPPNAGRQFRHPQWDHC